MGAGSESGMGTDVLDIWQKLAQLQWDGFTAGKVDVQTAQDVLQSAIRSRDPRLRDAVRRAIDELVPAGGAGIPMATQFEWLTSVVHGRRYPPIPLSVAGPTAWNDPTALERTNQRKTGSSGLELQDCTEPLAVEQHASIDDCSFVTALINLATHAPDALRVRPVGHGAYDVNLSFNGADDRLVRVYATDSSPRLSSEDPQHAVLEQAYLQIRGPAFGGSNAGVDTFLVGGFVPEMHDLASLDTHTVHQMLCGAGDAVANDECVVALSTGDHVTDSSLLPAHDYPLVVGRDWAGRRELQVRDPLSASLIIPISDFPRLAQFRAAYISWNPRRRFRRHERLHFRYSSARCNRFATVSDKPVFEVQGQDPTQSPHAGPSEVWVFLERHLPLDERAQDTLFCLPSPHGHHRTAQDSDTSNCGIALLKLKIPAGSATRVAVHTDTAATFTLHVLHNAHATACVRRVRRADLFCAEAEGVLRAGSNFGPFSNAEYYRNPAFSLEIPPVPAGRSAASKTVYLDIRLLLERHPETHAETPVNVQVFDVQDDELVRPIVFEETYVSAGHERRAMPLHAGSTYRLVCSAASADAETAFRLEVGVSDAALAEPAEPAQPYPSLPLKLTPAPLAYGSFPHRVARTFAWPARATTLAIPVKPRRLATPIHLRLLALDDALPVKSGVSFRMKCDDDDSSSSSFPPSAETALQAWQGCRENVTMPRQGHVIRGRLARDAAFKLMVLQRDGVTSETRRKAQQWRIELGSQYEVDVGEPEFACHSGHSAP
ncbi:LAMI_0D13212g1_1 [Lachancea mirantina]|uniref:Cysteine protease RIM13 n=1 Tax=Lachancea mirantina TaxID=1230905 RepID=A0A1G4JG97_9SACH|nr:LAMI_0D13212g1_1 [Lachancea mirantina]